MNYNDCFLIVENTTVPLITINSQIQENSTQQSNGSYIFEGMFTNLNGERNNNGRIYEKEMFMPFYEKCRLRAEGGNFVGECDHPKRFETQFNHASHVIEKIWFDDASQMIMGRIRLLNGHPVGEMVKSIVDNGITLNVSSRSAGAIDKEGKVQLKEVFTWDLVTTPGFSGTDMKRVQESLENKNISFDPSIFESHIPGSKGYINLSERYNLPNTIEVYDINGILSEKKVYSNNDLNIKEDSNLLSGKDVKQDLQKMLDYVNENFESLSSKIGSSENFDQELQLEFMKEYLAMMGDKINKFFEYHKYTTNVLQQVVDYQDHQTDAIKNIKEYSNYLGLNLENSIKYSEYLGENLEKNNKYSNYLGEMADKLREHSNYLSENLNNSIGYTEFSNIQVAEEIDKIKQYSNYLSEMLQEVSYMKQSSTEEASKIEENVKLLSEDVSFDTEDLTGKIDQLIESVVHVEKEKKSDLDFLKLVSLEKKQEFNLLSENKKQKLIEAVKQQNPSFKYEVLKIWEEVILKEEEEPVWLRLAPTKYKKIWENLSENVKDSISAQANARVFRSQIDVEDFWLKRPFNSHNKPLKEYQSDISLTKLLNSKSDDKPVNEKEKDSNFVNEQYGMSQEELDKQLGLIKE